MSSYPTSEGRKLLLALIETVDTNGAYLSEIDGATGDGDHGINMTKGVRRTQEKLGEQNVTVPQGLDMLGQVLLAEIGGAMGPLYGSFFIDMGTACGDAPAVDKEVFGKMLKAGAAAMQDLGGAKVGDKTMMDALVPAVEAYEKAVARGGQFRRGIGSDVRRGGKGEGGHPRDDREAGPGQPAGRTLQRNPGRRRGIVFAHFENFFRYPSKPLVKIEAKDRQIAE